MSAGGPAGYRHSAYAASFAEHAVPRHLPGSDGWVLERDVPDGAGARDAIGPYPLFACADWTALAADLAGLAGDLVAVSLVTDPFGGWDDELLRATFDVVRPYKPHAVLDLADADAPALPRKHRRNLGRAQEHVTVERVGDPRAHLDEWVALYDHLSERHGITGMRRFSREAFAVQLGVPGVVALRATAGDELVGLHLWAVDGDVAYGHLGATSDRGYALMASYALYQAAIDLLRDEVRWLDLGAGAGEQEGGDGLERFKAGWASGQRPTYVCGKVLQPDRYLALAGELPGPEPAYFPAYRAGEFSAVAAGGR